MPDSANTMTDVAIIGAGVAGLYCALRLLQQNPQQRIVIHEKAAQIGGRLTTDILSYQGNAVKCESGGMRFLAAHTHLMQLLDELGIRDASHVVPFSMGDENNLLYLRGQRFSRREAILSGQTVWKDIYRLSPQEQHMAPEALLNRVLHQLLLHNDIDAAQWWPVSPRDWQDLRCTMQYQGEAIYKWGLWPLLMAMGVSAECVQMLCDSGGFTSPYQLQINAGAALQLLCKFTTLPQFLTLEHGYQSLSTHMAERIGALHGQIRLQQQVQAIDSAGTGYRLRLADGTETQAKRVIIALPPGPLLRLLRASETGLNASPQLLADIDSVQEMPLTKINLYFARRWWLQAHGIRNGVCMSDLPISQVVFFDPLQGQDYASPAALTLYCDFFRQHYWHSLQNLGTPYRSPDFPAPPPNLNLASSFVVEQGQQYLQQMFGHDIPAPFCATYQSWGEGNDGSGDHKWKVGVNDIEVLARIKHPLPNLAICNEAFSDEQAWVEGALRSAHEALKALDQASGSVMK